MDRDRKDSSDSAVIFILTQTKDKKNLVVIDKVLSDRGTNLTFLGKTFRGVNGGETKIFTFISCIIIILFKVKGITINDTDRGVRDDLIGVIKEEID
jgi:hypothetical protein